MKKYLLIVLILLGAVYLFEGCVPSKPKEEVEILPSDRLIKRIEANRRRVKTFQGTGTIKIETKEINAPASFKVNLVRPDSLFMEIYGPFGIDVAQILVTERDFVFYDEINNVVHKGKSNSDILERIFKVKLSFADLTDAFAGAVNVSSKLMSEPSNYEVIFDKYILTYDDPGNETKTKYKIDIRELAITDYQILDNSDKPILEGIYSNFKVVDGISMPTFIQIVNNEENEKINITYRKIELNRSNVKISLKIPDDAKVEQW